MLASRHGHRAAHACSRPATCQEGSADGRSAQNSQMKLPSTSEAAPGPTEWPCCAAPVPTATLLPPCANSHAHILQQPRSCIVRQNLGATGAAREIPERCPTWEPGTEEKRDQRASMHSANHAVTPWRESNARFSAPCVLATAPCWLQRLAGPVRKPAFSAGPKAAPEAHSAHSCLLMSPD